MSAQTLANPRQGSKRDLRTLVPGIGTGGILIAAVVLAFATVGGLVAFNGMPQSSDAAPDGQVLIESNAPESAALVAAGAGGAPAAKPAPTAFRVVAALAVGPTTRAAGPTEGPPAGPPAVDVPVVEPTQPPLGPDGNGIGPALPPISSPPPVAPPPAATPAAAGGPGDVAGIVGAVDETVKGVTGVDPGLGGATAPITKPIDDIVKDLTGGKGLGLGDATPQLPLPPLGG